MDSSDLIMLLEPFGPCDVSDALLKLGLDDGYLTTPNLVPSASSSNAVKVIAPAYTVQVVAASNEAAPKYAGNYVDTCPHGAVLVVSVPEGARNGIFGGLLATRASVLGAQGIVTNGRVRDVAELRELDFPTFAGGTSIQSATGRTRVASVQESITIDGTTVHSGDMIVGDANGVVVVPRGSVAAVAEMAARLVAVDEKVAVDVRGGASLAESFKRWRP
ncbi:ribonuclease E inhibitor RraA/Dimethylmenaquinone methyltransferase [Blastocladiella britannica]|nr:ribonuclease E inhibitor RraA/Dimethylmenaquinone methyltransferase [Blastocladiella britannica]